ncbi:hypothetical protein BJY24_007150 [Nocardia transvalensis]|uniref:Golgi phosphoprotein 3 GPP34 n=1 Tax=Nocardia transvalensis TaxID=37333 RepID=A0A7W9PM70_9NOCA|nr:GPP34 family phosphoprotein [Nocardia transvalensis]MBB5918238.1 hypothetical protein [Nocardia transvalensis]
MAESLPAKAYLLAYRADRRRVPDRQRVGYLVRAAALAELLLRDRLADRGGVAALIGTSGVTGDLVLDDTLTMVSDGSRNWVHWVRKDHSRALHLVETQLAEAGVLVLEPGRALGIMPLQRRVVRNEAHLSDLRAVVDDALHGPLAVPDLPATDAVLTALLAATEFRHVISRSARRRNQPRVDALALQAAPAVDALQTAVRRLRTARVAIATGGGHT